MSLFLQEHLELTQEIGKLNQYKMPTVSAKLKGARVSDQKARLIANQIRGNTFKKL